MGKGVGDDFRDGKITLPVILALCARKRRRTATSGAQAMVEGEATGDAELARATILLADSGAIDDTLARARTYGQRAIDALGPFPTGKAKAALGRGGRVRDFESLLTLSRRLRVSR